MSQRTFIHGLGSGRSRGSLNLPGGRLACAEADGGKSRRLDGVEA